jgi:hypothetical protein
MTMQDAFQQIDQDLVNSGHDIKSVKGWLLSELVKNGMFQNQAEEVMQQFMPNHPTMNDRWDSQMDEYPQVMRAVLWMNLKHEALKYINEKCPMAWFKPLFE